MDRKMKCDNCGKDVVNFYYTSNINGNVTERHLCADCAAKLGYQNDFYSGMDSMFENMLSGFFAPRRSWSVFDRLGGFGFPTFNMPRIELRIDDGSGSAQTSECAECGEAGKGASTVDPELSRKREINVLREQMRQAVEAEEFEKAAELRDKIREMEK